MDENYTNQENGSTYNYENGGTQYSVDNVSPTQGFQYYQSSASMGGAGGNAYQAPKQARAKEKKASRGTGGKIAAVIGSAFLFGLIAGGVMFGVNKLGNKFFPTENKQKEFTTEIATVAAADPKETVEVSNNVADVVENVMPSIVSITNKSVQTVQSWFQSYEREVIGAGSGIIIGQTKDEILIVTNNHVINGAKEITVSFNEDNSVAATVKGTDRISDLAVLAVKAKDMDSSLLKEIKVAALGSSDNLRVGESAIAIGNALGYGQSVTVGYISALNRDVEAEEGSSIKMLQTDAAINPGNSGGALLNAKGEVIGINSAKYMDTKVEGMGYAIPISDAIPIINELMNAKVIEESEQGYLGIQGNDVTDEYAQGFNMPKGVYVVKILDDSPANDCGLKAGDIITEFAGRQISGMANLQSVLSTKKAGEEIKMVIQRNNEKGEYEEVTLTVILGAKKDMPNYEESESNEEDSKTPEEDAENGYEGEVPYYNPDEFLDEFQQFFGW